jgi:type IV secretion system protein VirB9
MKRLLFAMTILSSPAMALQTPTPGKIDPRICDVVYNADDVVDVRAVMGETVAIRFDPAEAITDVPLSDTIHVKRATGSASNNILWLKATETMPPQPIGVRTKRADGSSRDYAFRWTSLSDDKPAGVSLAASGPLKMEEILVPRVSCYMIRFTYPSDVTAAQAAAWRARQAKQKADEAEIALHKADEDRSHNVRYVAQGDASIGPTAIWDDGNTTTLVFPGNMRIPVIVTRLADKLTDAEVTGMTSEQGGMVKIHGVLPFIRLRDGDLTLCLWNRAYAAIGNNPGTGTTSNDIERHLGERP